jgi:hypothetical protein
MSQKDQNCNDKNLKEPWFEDEGKKEPSYTAGGNTSYCNHSGKKFGGFLRI